jgi:hypothetical protein
VAREKFYAAEIFGLNFRKKNGIANSVPEMPARNALATMLAFVSFIA